MPILLFWFAMSIECAARAQICISKRTSCPITRFVLKYDTIFLSSNSVDRNDSELLQLFSHCLTIHRPSSLRGGLGVTRLGNMQMSSLGGLENIKSCLRSFIEWPLNHPKAFKRLGIPIPKGTSRSLLAVDFRFCSNVKLDFVTLYNST